MKTLINPIDLWEGEVKHHKKEKYQPSINIDEYFTIELLNLEDGLNWYYRELNKLEKSDIDKDSVEYDKKLNKIENKIFEIKSKINKIKKNIPQTFNEPINFIDDLNSLVNFANYLDMNGLKKMADEVDKIIKYKAFNIYK